MVNSKIKVMITGAPGLLGRALSREFSKSYEVIRTSRTGKNSAIACDLGDSKQVAMLFERVQPQLIIHGAAFTDVDGCEQDPATAYHANALATKELADRAGKGKIPFVYISTDYVFDGKKGAAYEEADKTSPVNIYGMTKLAGEVYTRQLAHSSAIIRSSWLFGEGQPKNFVDAIVERLRKGEALQVLGDQHNSPTYVPDLALAVRNLADWLMEASQKFDRSPCGEIFQICNALVTTRYEMALEIRQILGLQSVAIDKLDSGQLPKRLAVRPAFSAMSPSKYESLLGMKMRPWQESLADYLAGRAS